MKSDFWVFMLGGLMAAAGMGLGWFIGEPAFHIRMVQSGSHESILILLALVIGFTFKEGNDNNSVSALVLALFMAVFGLIMSGLEDLQNLNVRTVGFVLYGGFTTSLVGTLYYLLRAIKFRQ